MLYIIKKQDPSPIRKMFFRQPKRHWSKTSKTVFRTLRTFCEWVECGTLVPLVEPAEVRVLLTPSSRVHSAVGVPIEDFGCQCINIYIYKCIRLYKIYIYS